MIEIIELVKVDLLPKTDNHLIIHEAIVSFFRWKSNVNASINFCIVIGLAISADTVAISSTRIAGKKIRDTI
jgi:hypothetical protein